MAVAARTAGVTKHHWVGYVPVTGMNPPEIPEEDIGMVLVLTKAESAALASLLYNLDTELFTNFEHYIIARNQHEALMGVRKEAFGY